LADHLAQEGFPTLRFDYSGTGDSSGDDLDPDCLGAWKQNIKAVIAYTKAITGCSKICLIGIRMGATLSALIASEKEVGVSHLVLWAPCIQGRQYVREMKALAQDALSRPISDGIESAGFILSAETIEKITKINLQGIDFPQETQVLLIDRDDRQQYRDLSEQWIKRGIHLDYLVASGYLSMFAEPHETVVPSDTLRLISEWLTKNTSEKTSAERPLEITKQAIIHSSIREHLCSFGDRGQLFGVLTVPLRKADPSMPTIILMNAGSVHHVGPQRLYVHLARALALQGFPCFRIDFEGIGDSNLQNVSEENHPYQETAVQDAESALRFLTEQFHLSEFVLTGICSGAYTAFHAGLTTTQYKILDTLLINPLTFHWEKGMSLSMDAAKITQAIRKMSHYKQSVHDPKQWIKLLKGEIPWKSTLRVGMTQIQLWAQSYYKDLLEHFWPQADSRLSANIKGYFRMDRHLSLFLAETDPGLDLVMMDARNAFKKGIKENKISLQTFQNADHTFSHTEKRDELIRRMGKHLTQITH